MGITLIATASGTDDASDTTLNCSSSLNVALGDLLVAYYNSSNKSATHTIADTAAGNAFTMLTAVNATQSYRMGFGYKLSATANATSTFRLTLSQAGSNRRIGVYQFRPTAGGIVSLDGAQNPAEGSGTTPQSGNISTIGTDEVVLAFSGMWDYATLSSPLIADAAATGSLAAGTYVSSWYKLFTATQTNIHAQGTLAGSDSDWLCNIVAFKSVTPATITADGPQIEKTTQIDPYIMRPRLIVPGLMLATAILNAPAPTGVQDYFIPHVHKKMIFGL